MRLLFIAPDLRAGGAERHWADLLPALARRGDAPRVLTLKGGGPFVDPLRAAGIPVTVCPRGYRDMRHLASSISKEFHRRPEVIVTLGINAALLGAFGGRSIGAPHIVNFHTGVPIAGRQHLILRVCARLGSRVIAVASSQLPQLNQLGFDPRHVTVIRNAVLPRPPKQSAAAVRESLGIHPDHDVVLAVGRLERLKALTIFVSAVARLQSNGRLVTGVVAGDGPEREALEQQANQESAEILFLGFRGDMEDLYATADVLCITSQYEAMPMIILEAFSAGLPVVAPAIGDIPALVSDGVTGVLVQTPAVSSVAEAVSMVLDCPDREGLRDRVQGMHHAHFRHDLMVDAYASAFQSARRAPADIADL